MILRSIVLLFLLVHAPTVAQWGPCGANKDEVLQMGRKIEKELPLGSTKVQVVKVLEDMQLQPSRPSVVYGGSPRYRRLRQMGATVETPAHNEPALYLRFYLDKRGNWWNLPSRTHAGLAVIPCVGTGPVCFGIPVIEMRPNRIVGRERRGRELQESWMKAER